MNTSQWLLNTPRRARVTWVVIFALACVTLNTSCVIAMPVLVVRAGHAAQWIVIVTMGHLTFQPASCTGLGSGKHLLACPAFCHNHRPALDQSTRPHRQPAARPTTTTETGGVLQRILLY